MRLRSEKLDAENAELDVELYSVTFDFDEDRTLIGHSIFAKPVPFVQPISCKTISDRKLSGPVTHVLNVLALEITALHFKTIRLHFYSL